MSLENPELLSAYEDYQNLNLGGKWGVSEKFIPGMGQIPSKIMFVGEAPGEIEDRLGLPFQGPSGKVFDDLLELIALSRDNVFVTNAFKYHPPKNRDPFANEIRKSIPCLNAEINAVQPEIIVTLGRVALECFFPPRTIKSMRNKKHRVRDRIVICTYHPAVLLYSHSPVLKNEMRADFRLIGESLKEIT